MADLPEPSELLEAVRDFLMVARKELAGHRAFHALVAAKVLEIAAREVAEGPAMRSRERDGLQRLLQREGEPETLNRILCELIRRGDISIDDPDLLDHLDRTTLARLAVDQPGYSGIRLATEAGVERDR